MIDGRSVSEASGAINHTKSIIKKCSESRPKR